MSRRRLFDILTPPLDQPKDGIEIPFPTLGFIVALPWVLASGMIVRASFMRAEERRPRMVGCDRARRTSGGNDELSWAVEAGYRAGGWVLRTRGCWSGLMGEMELMNNIEGEIHAF